MTQGQDYVKLSDRDVEAGSAAWHWLRPQKHSSDPSVFRCYWHNTSVNLAFYLVALLAAYVFSIGKIAFVLMFITVYMFELFLVDIAYYIFQINVIDPDENLRHGYNWSLALDCGSAKAEGMDYGFNFYDGNFEKTPKQAQLDKFEYAFKRLGLQKGMRLLDCGCGCGDWITWLTEVKGVETVGINITEAQVEVCKARGRDVVGSDWKKIAGNPELEQKLFGKFDAMSFWDTVEHYVPMKYAWRRNKCMPIYEDMFLLAKNALNKDSPCQKVWISCLHLNKESSLYQTSYRRYFMAWCMDKMHSGAYPLKGELIKAAEANTFKNEVTEDRTEDYYMTSVLCPDHFGRHLFKWKTRIILVLLWQIIIDPCWIARMIWLFNETWMFQFDTVNIDNSMVNLLWLVFDLKK